MIALALYQPEIPHNTGTLLRLAACMGVKLYIIEPCGFALSDSKLKRSGMDYIDLAAYERFESWDFFMKWAVDQKRRMILTTPHTDQSYIDFKFQENDIILMGRESDGVPLAVHKQCQGHVKIPMVSGCRSLNMALCGGMITAEALRQCQQMP